MQGSVPWLGFFWGVILGLFAGGCTPEAKFEGRPLAYWLQETKSPNESVRVRAIIGLGILQPSNPEPDVLRAIIEATKDGSFSVRFHAITALGAYGPEAKEALPEIRNCLKDDKPNVRQMAEWALRRVEGKAKAAEQKGPNQTLAP